MPDFKFQDSYKEKNNNNNKNKQKKKPIEVSLGKLWLHRFEFILTYYCIM